MTLVRCDCKQLRLAKKFRTTDLGLNYNVGEPREARLFVLLHNERNIL